MKDHYKTLGVDRSVSDDELKKVFRKLSMQYHPDRNPNNPESEAKFKEINEAYSVLSKPEKRQQYDNPNPFGNMFDSADIFSRFAGRRPAPRKPDLNAPKDGQFIGVEVELPLKLYLFGGKFSVKLSFNEGCSGCGGKGFTESSECGVCNGMGVVEHIERRPGFVSSSHGACGKCRGLGQIATNKCEVCGGTGNINVKDKEFVFDVPIGTNIGSKVISRGVGRAGVNGGRTGDVGIMISNIKSPNVDKLTDGQIEQLKDLLEERVDEAASA